MFNNAKLISPMRATLPILAIVASLGAAPAAEARGRLHFHAATHHAGPSDPASAAPSPSAAADPWGADNPDKPISPGSNSTALGLLGGAAVMLGGLVVIVRGLRARA